MKRYGVVFAMLMVLGLSGCENSAHERMQRQQWYNSLTPEQQDREDRREAEALRALGMALSGGGPRFQSPSYSVPPYQRPLNCFSNQAGQTVYTNCY